VGLPKLALLALLPAVAHATCAIAVWTPDSIILGSDSRETLLSPEYGQMDSSGPHWESSGVCR